MYSTTHKNVSVLAYTAFAALLAVAATGCAGQGSRAAQPALLQQAATALVGGDSNQAVTLYTDFLGTNPDSPQAAEAYLGRGNAYFKLKKYSLADMDYQSAVAKATDKTVKAQATMGLGNVAAATDHYDIAGNIYRQVLSSYSGQAPQDEATYRLALSLARQGRWDDAAKLLEKVTSEWPSGEYARYAKAKLAIISGKTFTVQVGAFNKKEPADKAAAQLKAKGFPARIDTVSGDGVTLYAVRSGSFATWQEATQQANKLKGAGFSTFRLP